MNSYYLTLVLKPEMGEKERKDLLDLVTKKLVGEEGKVEKEDLWGKRPLAYPIKRQTAGFFAHFQIQAETKNAKGLDKSLDLEEDVLRYLLIKR
ncbi:30S ribosomal protein S6 [Candidatus Daviesbacteria bacterium]|nr:30S ribosomal protein S6 [Candidatus Daviesbacteria bacterium]